LQFQSKRNFSQEEISVKRYGVNLCCYATIKIMGTRKKLTPSDDGKPRHFIKEWRNKRRMTLEQLANAVDLAVSSISQLERGQQGYSQATLEALAAALGCSPVDLISRPPDNDNAWRAKVTEAVHLAQEAGVDRQDVMDEFLEVMRRVRELEKAHPERIPEAIEAARRLLNQSDTD
jgi:transcriptional regulator with XRE-family HTH domain